MRVLLHQFLKAFLVIIIPNLTGVFLQKPAAQIDSIFKYNSSQRIFKLSGVVETDIFKFDSAKASSIFDTVIHFGDANNDKRLAWYARYYKLIYVGRQYHNAEKEIANMQGMKDWIDDCPVPVIQAVYKHTFGNLLYFDKQYGEAFNLMLQAQHTFEEIGFVNIPEICQYEYELANDYYDFGDYNNSIKYGRLSEKYSSPFNNVNSSKFNTEALAYRKLGDFENSKKYFLLARNYAQKMGDTVWIGIVSGNLGNTLMMQGKYRDAITFLQQDYNANRNIMPDEAALTAINLAECYAQTGQAALAKSYQLQAQNQASPALGANFLKKYYKATSNYYAAMGNSKMAYLAEDSMNKINDSLNKSSSADILASAEKRLQTENYLNNLSLANEKQKNNLIIRNLIASSVAIVLCLLVVLVFIRYRVIAQKQQLLRAEKISVDERLHHAEFELKTYIRNIADKINLSAKASTELQEFKKNLPEAIPLAKLETLSVLFQFTLLTDEDWLEFKRLFDVVHPNFFAELKSRYPSFTPAEVRLLSLLKLKLTNKEISGMIGVSPDTVTRTKYRLRKKFGDLRIEAELETFAESL